MNINKIASLDTETSFNKERCVPIPFIATSTNTNLESQLLDLSLEDECNKLKEFCVDPNITKVFHNATYDIYVASNIGINCVGPYEDTMLMATLVNENFDSKKLKVLAKVHLGEQCLEDEELRKVKSKYKKELKKNIVEMGGDEDSIDDLDDVDYSCIPPEVLYPYAIKDAIYTLKLYFLFRKTVYEKYKDLYEFEKSLIPVVVEMTQHGFNIDREFVKKMIDEYNKEVVTLDAEMLKYVTDREVYSTGTIARKTDAGIIRQAEKIGMDNVIDVTNDDEKGFILTYKKEFNAGSPQCLRTIIEKLGIIVTVYTKGKNPVISTDKEAFKSIPKDSPNYKFIELLIRWRFLTKQLSTYYRPLYYKYTSETNSIAHFIFYQSGAKSGRFTAQLVQTIPRTDEVEDERFIRHIRKAFIPRPKRILVAIDYDQIEMRIFAHFSRCKALIDAINAGYDPHTGTAYTLFGKDFVESQTKERAKHYRRIAKNINFGIIYGMGKTKLANSLGLPMREALEILDVYHKSYPVKQHIAEQTAMLYKRGHVSIEADSSLMRFKRDYHVPSELAYKAVNIRIQGMAAYCMKYGIKRSYDWIKQEKLDIPLICTIHDELFFEVWEQDYDIEIVRSLTTQMEDRVSFDVPILASPKVSSISWGDAQEIKL